MSIESVMPSSHLILCHPLVLRPPIPPSIRVFSNESTLGMRWPKYWSFSFSIIPSKEHPGLISFRMDWLDLLAVQGTLKSFLQHHSTNASVLRHSAFFTVQLSHPYMTTGKRELLDPANWKSHQFSESGESFSESICRDFSRANNPVGCQWVREWHNLGFAILSLKFHQLSLTCPPTVASVLRSIWCWFNELHFCLI